MSDIFLRDTQNGTTSRVSVGQSGAQANSYSGGTAISASGRFVVFQSAASNLVPLDTNAAYDVFVRDTQAGSTTRVSVSSQGLQSLVGSFGGAISDDGNRVVFYSTADSLVLGDTNGVGDIFVRDRTAGTTVRVSVSSSGSQGNGYSFGGAISGNGRYVAFDSDASNLVSGDSNGNSDAFVRDLTLGTTSRISRAASGAEGNGDSFGLSLSTDGRFIAFESLASNLAPSDSNNASDIFRYDSGEKQAPTISSLTPMPSAFSPNGDGVKDTTTIGASVSDESPPIAWTLKIKNSTGVQVRSFSGTGSSVAQVWDGVDSLGIRVPDGVYTAMLTATDDWNNSASQSTSVQVDTLPPIVAPGGITPVDRFGDVLRLTTLSVTWQDALSGVDGATLRMWLDSTPLATSVSGSTVTGTPAGTPSGIHLIDLEGRDLAGNLATDTFPFTLVSVTASPGNASLVAQTVQVNPNNKIPPPSTARFSQPKLDVGTTTETINASSRVGHGTSSRYVTLGSVDVLFNNGSLTKTVTVSVPTTTESHKVGAAAPSSGALKAVIDAHRMSIADIVVDVPLGFNTAQSKATLIAKTVPLGAPVISDGPFIGNAWEDSVPMLGTIGVCFAGNGDGLITDCQIDTSANVYAKVGPVPDVRQIYVPTLPANDTSLDGSVPQACAGCVQPDALRAGAASFVLRCPTAVVQGRSFNLCSGVPNAPAATGPWSGYLNTWLYKEGNPVRFPLWQQNHAQGTSASCPNGANGQATARTYRVVTNALANDASTGAVIGGTWDDQLNPSLLEEYVYLGTKTGNSRPGQLVENLSIGFQLSNEAPSGGATVPLSILGEGAYLQANPSGFMDASGAVVSTASGTTNGWQHNPASLSNGQGSMSRVQIMTGSEFRTLNSTNTYNVTASLAFQLVLDFSQC